jgi:transposase
MITPPPGVRVYLACGYTDMRKGMATLAMLVQQTLSHDPFSGAVYAFRGRHGGSIKVLWHDGVGMCLFIKRLERGQFIWPMSAAGTVSLSAGQLACSKAVSGEPRRATCDPSWRVDANLM